MTEAEKKKKLRSAKCVAYAAARRKALAAGESEEAASLAGKRVAWLDDTHHELLRRMRLSANCEMIESWNVLGVSSSRGVLVLE